MSTGLKITLFTFQHFHCHIIIGEQSDIKKTKCNQETLEVTIYLTAVR